MTPDKLKDEDFARLLRFRDGLRQFLKWSDDRAREAGVTPQHHQLLLIVRGHPGGGGPTVGDVADHLLVRHHSAVEMVNRAEEAGLVRRTVDPEDHRVVRVTLTPRGEDVLEYLSEQHLAELGRLVPEISRLWAELDDTTSGDR